MKIFLFMLTMFAMLACSHNSRDVGNLQEQVDQLKGELAKSYKPGFGELMTAVQTHHAKLWFAGKNKNWKLAAFEIHEIDEVIEKIQKYQKSRKESALLPMITPALDSVSYAIIRQNLPLFKKSFVNLTETCNTCHISTQFEFNIVKIPTHSPFTNQDFKMKN